VYIKIQHSGKCMWQKMVPGNVYTLASALSVYSLSVAGSIKYCIIFLPSVYYHSLIKFKVMICTLQSTDH
jgi:hypothetical protein